MHLKFAALASIFEIINLITLLFYLKLNIILSSTTISILILIIIIILVIKLLNNPFQIIPNIFFNIVCTDGLMELFLFFTIYLIRYIILPILLNKYHSANLY